jgi:hypothetical protein
MSNLFSNCRGLYPTDTTPIKLFVAVLGISVASILSDAAAMKSPSLSIVPAHGLLRIDLRTCSIPSTGNACTGR